MKVTELCSLRTCSVLHVTADEMLKCAQYFPDVQFIMLSKVVLRFESVDQILKYFIQMTAIKQCQFL